MRDANGGVVVVEIQYRLGLFGEVASFVGVEQVLIVI